MPDHDADRAAIIAVIEGESAAYLAKDHDRWASFWLQTAAVRHWTWSHDVGMFLHAGWDRVSASVRASMAAFPKPLHDTVRREWLDFTITAEMAWVTFDQYSTNRGDPLESAGLQHEMWILQRHDSRWLVSCVSTLQPRSQLADCPVVQVDAQSLVLWANPQARRRLQDHAELTVSAGRLRARNRQVDRQLHAAVTWAAGSVGSPLKRASLRQTATTGGALPVLAPDTGLGAQVLCWVQPTDGMVLVTFDDASILDRRIGAAAMIFGLSPGQRRLARLLIDGHDLAAAANALSVSVNTARTQLQRIFDKTGVRTQSALVRVLLSIAPPI